MTTTEINALSETDASNTSISGVSIAELCPAANINDAQRATLGAVKRMYDRDHATATVGGTANAITLAYTSGPASYVTGEKFAFIATATNSSTTVVNINSLGAKNVYRQTGSGPAVCVGGEIATGAIIELEYDGTQFQIVSGNAVAPYLRGYLSGCILSNDGVTPNTKIDVSAGVAMDSTNAVMITLPATVINWGATGAAGLDTGSIASSTWYHIYAIAKADGTASAIASTSASSPSPMPTGYTYKRRIGSVKSDGSSHLLAFSQVGDEFLWSVCPQDVSGSTVNVASASLLTLSVPTGVQVEARITGYITAGTAAGLGFTSPDESDQAMSSNGLIDLALSASGAVSGRVHVRTNTSSQIRARAATSSVTLYLGTHGWRDDRGKLA